MSIKDKVKELGGTGIVPGPSKMYATGLPTEEKAREFIDWMHETYNVVYISHPLKMVHNPGYDVGYAALFKKS